MVNVESAAPYRVQSQVQHNSHYSEPPTLSPVIKSKKLQTFDLQTLAASVAPTGIEPVSKV